MKGVRMAKSLYLQIKEMLLENIKDKPANTPISSEREIALNYNASRMTVRKAVEELVEDGYLYRDKNKGTFVADVKMRKRATNVLLAEAEDNIHYKMLYFDLKQRSDEDILKYLRTPYGEYVLRVVRVAEQEDEPVSIEEIYVARKNISDSELGNLKQFLDLDKYIKAGGMNQTFVPTLIPTQYASLLHLKMNTPIIRVDSIIHKINGKPYIFVRSYYNPNKKKIEITL